MVRYMNTQKDNVNLQIQRAMFPAGERIKQSFFVPVRFPSWNVLIDAAGIRRGKWSKYWSLKQTLTTQVTEYAYLAFLRCMKRVDVAIFTYHEPNRRRDKDNVGAAKKFILDGLVKAGVLIDDSPRYVKMLVDRFVYPDEPRYKEPGVEITLIGRG